MPDLGTSSAASRPELLAPAGDFEALRAAVANGADAVYFGLHDFNARHRAANFSFDELPGVLDYLHQHNVRGYVTVNTLIFSDELPAIAQHIQRIAEAGADAVIVQDLGLVRLIKAIAPTLAVHGSTQMTLTEPRGIEFVRSLGVERVILARESTLADIQRIRSQSVMPLEVFVHGALCISYSGQCLTSEALGGRSANRGQCAQACRLPYELIVDGKPRDLGDKAYLLSPQDLAAPDLVNDLAELGVVSLKIEGRLKSAQYVAAATQTYRAAVDSAGRQTAFRPSPQQQLDLQQSFSRGFSHGFFDGVDHQVLVQGRFPKHRGVRAGTVVEVRGGGVVVRLERGVMLKPGDGVVFDEGHPDQDEQGGRVAQVRAKPQALAGATPQSLELRFHEGSVNVGAIAAGAIVWRTDDPAIRRRLEQSYSREQVVHRRPLHVHVAAAAGQPLTLTFSNESGRTVAVQSDHPLEAAVRQPLTLATAHEQLGRMGDTPFELSEVTFAGGVDVLPVMAPKSVLNELRRRAVSQLMQEENAKQKHGIEEPTALERMRAEIRISAPSRKGGASSAARDGQAPPCRDGAPQSTESKLYILARTLPQLEAVLAWRFREVSSRLAMVYCEFEDIRKYKDAVAAARTARVPIGLATTRVLKPHEEGLLRQLLDCQPDAVLMRHLASLSFVREHAPQLPLIADYSFNIANELTAGLIAEHGVARMVPSFDLNWPQLSAMAQRFNPALFEAVIHQHMPMFHMEHCVFCATLSNGKDYRDCGRPCDHHQVDLNDRANAAHPLVADVGCRNTVYNGVAQSAAEFVPRMIRLGIRHFRVELLREKPHDVAPLLDRYSRVLDGKEDGRRIWSQLRVLNQLGVTRGTLEHE